MARLWRTCHPAGCAGIRGTWGDVFTRTSNQGHCLKKKERKKGSSSWTLPGICVDLCRRTTTDKMLGGCGGGGILFQPQSLGTFRSEATLESDKEGGSHTADGFRRARNKDTDVQVHNIKPSTTTGSSVWMNSSLFAAHWSGVSEATVSWFSLRRRGD